MTNKIHNIFSTEKEETVSKSIITIDHREKNSLIPAFLIEQGFQIKFEQLPVADYLINDIAIERKTIADLKASIINKRIFTQLHELKQYPNHLILIEGIISDDLYNSRMHENAVRGFLLTLATKFQTPVIYTYDEKDTAKYLSILAQKKEKSDFSIRPNKKDLTKEEQMQFILEGFPNIGATKAKALIKKFQTLNNIFNAQEVELEEILGKQAKDFRDLLN